MDMADGNAVAERQHAHEQGRLTDAADLITKDDLANAREDLIDRLVEGKKIGFLTSHGIFEIALQESGHSGYHGVMDLLGGILHINNYDRERDDGERARELAETAKGFIERYVDAHPDMILERAEEINAEEE